MSNTSGCAFSTSSSSTTRVRPATHRLGQLAALLVADVAGRGADEARYGELLAVLAHVDADHRLLVVEEEVGERLGELGLADAGRAEEEEGAGGPVRIGDARTSAADGIGDGGDGRALADQPLADLALEAQQLLGLALQQPPHGDAGPGRDDGGDVLIGHLLVHHPRLVGLLLGLLGFERAHAR